MIEVKTSGRTIVAVLSVLLFVVVLSAALPAKGVEASGARDVPEFYSRWQLLTTEELFVKGRHFISEDVNMDSALVCYTVVANRLRDHLNSDNATTYARALNNIGYLYYSHYNDYAQADALFDEAIELAAKYDISEQLPYLYLNKGNISYLFESINGVPQSESRIIDNCKRTFHTSVEAQAWSCATAAFYSMAVFTLGEGDISEIQSEIDTYARLSIPGDTPQRDICDIYLRVLLAFRQGQMGQCISLLEQIALNDAPEGYDHFNRVVNATTTMAHLYTQMHQQAQAQMVLSRLDHLVDGSSSMMAQVVAYGMMQSFFAGQGDTSRAQHYEYLKLRAKNELQEEHRFSDIGQNRFLRQLNHVTEDLKAEQTASFWKSVVLVIVSLAFVLIAVVLVLLVRSYNSQRRYVAYLYEQNLRLLSTNQPLKALEAPLSAPEGATIDSVSPYKTIEAPSGAVGGAATSGGVGVAAASGAVGGAADSGAVKGATTSGTAGVSSALIDAIVSVMSQTGVVCQPDFSLSTLCNLTGYNHTYVSQAIRYQWGTNFNGLLNSYRITEACRRMNDVENYGNLTIEAIATGVGYASRSHFSTLFKKITGMTAADYLKMARRKASAGSET